MRIAPDRPPPAPPPDFLGPPPPMRDQETASYNTLVTRLTAEVGPSDVSEQIWLREVADNIWEVARLRRARVSVQAGAAEEGLRLLLDGLGVDKPGPLAARWAAGDADAVAAVDATLARAGFDQGHIMASALVLRLDETQALLRLEGDAIERRRQAIREIARHRGEFAEALQRAALAADEAARAARPAAAQSEAGR